MRCAYFAWLCALAIALPGRAAVEPAGTVRIVSYNAYNRPPERRARFERGAAEVWGLRPDIVALQEIGSGWLLPRDFLNVFLDAAPALGDSGVWHAHYAWQEENWGIYRNGLAVVSRFPVTHAEYHELESSNLWDLKGVLMTTVVTPGGSIDVWNVHLRATASVDVKRAELGELARYVAGRAKDRDLLLVGDFNWDWNADETQRFVRTLEARSLFDKLPPQRWITWSPSYRSGCDWQSAEEPHQQIDNILLIRGESAMSAIAGGGVHAPEKRPHPSDHCALYADVEVVTARPDLRAARP